MTLDTYSILLDANIHLSKTLRDWIYLLSFATEEQVYEIFHTRDIQAEVDYHTRRKFPDADGNLLDRWWKHLEKMTTSKMITGFTVDPHRAEYQDFPDPHDLHVVEAARHKPVDALVTNDVGLLTWATDVDDSLHFEVMDADSFLMQVVEFTDEGSRLRVLDSQLQYWSQRDQSGYGVDLPGRLTQAGAPLFAREVQRLLRARARRL